MLTSSTGSILNCLGCNNYTPSYHGDRGVEACRGFRQDRTVETRELTAQQMLPGGFGRDARVGDNFPSLLRQAANIAHTVATLSSSSLVKDGPQLAR
jgi:hypothetical protein